MSEFEEKLAALEARFDRMAEQVATDITRLELLAGQNQKHFDTLAADVRRLEEIADTGV